MKLTPEQRVEFLGEYATNPDILWEPDHEDAAYLSEWLYAYRANDLVKFGWSRSPWDRLWALRTGYTSVARPMGHGVQTFNGDLIAVWPAVPDGRQGERAFFATLPDDSHVLGEWWRYDDATRAVLVAAVDYWRSHQRPEPWRNPRKWSTGQTPRSREYHRRQRGGI